MKTLVLFFFILVSFSVKGQNSAESYFDNGAQMYAHNKLEKAGLVVEEGLGLHPNDSNLIKLKSRIEEEKKKEKKEEKDKEGDNKKEDKKDEGNKDNKEGDNKKEDEEKPKDEKKDKGKGDEEKKDEQKPKPQPGQMSPQQMKNLLEAMNNQEQKVQEKMNAEKRKGVKIKTDKDW